MNFLVKRTVQNVLGLDKKSTLPKSLLSPVTFQNLVFSLNWGSISGGIPFEYDKSRNCLIVTKKSVTRWKFVTAIQFMNFTYFVGSMAYLVFTQLWTNNINNGSSNNLANIKRQPTLFDTAFSFIVTILTFSMLIVNVSVGSFHRTEFASLINRELQFLIYLKEKFTNRLGGKWRNGCEEILVLLRIAMTTFPVIAGLHFIQHPENMIYMTSHISRDSTLYRVACICNASLLTILQVAGLGTIFGVLSPMIGFVFSFVNLIQEIKAGKKVYRTKPSFRHPEALRGLIRALQLLSNQINGITGQILIYQQSLITYTGTVCIFCAIHFWSGLTISGRGILMYTAVTTIGIWTVILTVGSHIYTATEKALNSWRNYGGWTHGEKKEMKKFRKSVRPIQFEFGGFYYLRPKKIMGFWNTLIWLVVRSLLTFPVHH